MDFSCAKEEHGAAMDPSAMAKCMVHQQPENALDGGSSFPDLAERGRQMEEVWEWLRGIRKPSVPPPAFV